MWDGMVTDHTSDLLAGDHNSSTHVSGDVVNSGFAMAGDPVFVSTVTLDIALLLIYNIIIVA